jgi:hypothetical protein
LLSSLSELTALAVIPSKLTVPAVVLSELTVLAVILSEAKDPEALHPPIPFEPFNQ